MSNNGGLAKSDKAKQSKDTKSVTIVAPHTTYISHRSWYVPRWLHYKLVDFVIDHLDETTFSNDKGECILRVCKPTPSSSEESE